MSIIDAIRKNFGTEDNVGASEYRALMEVLDGAENDPEMMICICQEFEGWGASLKKFIQEQPKDQQ